MRHEKRNMILHNGVREVKFVMTYHMIVKNDLKWTYAYDMM